MLITDITSRMMAAGDCTEQGVEMAKERVTQEYEVMVGQEKVLLC